jgi:hypothetical protein
MEKGHLRYLSAEIEMSASSCVHGYIIRTAVGASFLIVYLALFMYFRVLIYLHFPVLKLL